MRSKNAKLPTLEEWAACETKARSELMLGCVGHADVRRKIYC